MDLVAFRVFSFIFFSSRSTRSLQQQRVCRSPGQGLGAVDDEQAQEIHGPSGAPLPGMIVQKWVERGPRKGGHAMGGTSRGGCLIHRDAILGMLEVEKLGNGTDLDAFEVFGRLLDGRQDKSRKGLWWLPG